MKRATLEGFLKRHKHVPRTIETAEVELFVALAGAAGGVAGAVGVLNVPLEN